MTHGELDTMINNADFNGILRKSLPAAISMQLAKIIRKCNDELIEFNMEKQKIIQQYSIKDKDGKPNNRAKRKMFLLKKNSRKKPWMKLK
jgi:CRISPR/Cas system-associated endoribonuclease Cas2